MALKDSVNKENPTTTADTSAPKHRSPAIAWVALVLAVVAWLILVWSDGYLALAAAVLALLAGILGVRHRSPGATRLAITAIIAALVLIVVIASYLVVLKVIMN